MEWAVFSFPDAGSKIGLEIPDTGECEYENECKRRSMDIVPPPVIPPSAPVPPGPPRIPVPPRAKTPFPHQAATFSVIAPLAAFAIGVVSQAGMSSMDRQDARMGLLVVGIANCLIILLGLLFGIIALFGIPKHGTKGILGRALIGILINAIVVAMGVTVFLRAKELSGH